MLAGIFTTLLVFDIGRVRWNARAGLLAGLILLSVPLFAMQTPTARLDVPFTAGIVFSAWAWLAAPAGQRETRLSAARVAAFWAGLIGAFFIKGPLCLIAIFGMLLGESWRARSWQPWRSVRPLPGLTLLLVLITGWLASQGFFVGREQAGAQLASGTLDRFFDADHMKPAWYYAKTLLGQGFQPWVLFLGPALIVLWKRREQAMPDGVRPLLFWSGILLLTLHLLPGKRSHYLLPALPALVLLTAWFIETHFLIHVLSARLKLLFTGLGAAFLLVLLSIGIASEIYQDRLSEEMFLIDDVQHILMGVILIFMIATFVAFLRRRTAWRAVLMLALLTIGGEVFYLSVVNTARNSRQSARPFASVINAMMRPGEVEIAAAEDADKPEYHVYGQYRVRPLDLEASPDPADLQLPRLVVAREDSDTLDQILGWRGYEKLLSLPADDDRLVIFREKSDFDAVGPTGDHAALRFAIAGDTGVGDEYDQRRLLKQMVLAHEEKPFDAFFLLGDNLYGEEPFSMAMSKRFILPFSPFLKDGVPFFAAIGNHDNDHPDRIESELASPLLGMEGRDHFTRTFGDNLLTLFVLNSVKLEDREWEQLDWFTSALAESESRWNVLAMHHPIVASKTGHGAETEIFERLNPLLSIPPGIDIVFAGHNHFFERRAPVDGVWHITLGAGGKLEDDEPFPSDPNQIAGYMDGLSYGYIDVDRDSIRFTAVSEHGDILDQFEISDSETSSQKPETVVAHSE